MVVAMVAVRVVQVAIDQVVDVVTVRDGFVAATGAMGVVMVGVMGQLAFAHDDLLSAIDNADYISMALHLKALSIKCCY